MHHSDWRSRSRYAKCLKNAFYVEVVFLEVIEFWGKETDVIFKSFAQSTALPIAVSAVKKHNCGTESAKLKFYPKALLFHDLRTSEDSIGPDMICKNDMQGV